MLSFHCCAWAFSGCSKQELLSSWDVWASLCSGFSCCRAEALDHEGFSSCGPRAQFPHSMWNLPGPGVIFMSPAWAGGFLTIEPPGKSTCIIFATIVKSKKKITSHTIINWEIVVKYRLLVTYLNIDDKLLFLTHWSKFMVWWKEVMLHSWGYREENLTRMSPFLVNYDSVLCMRLNLNSSHWSMQ